RLVAEHERCYGRQQEILDLEHYLDVLERKPGAMAGSKPLEQWRRLGKWPRSYDRLWEGLMERRGKQAGTRGMIALLRLGRSHGHKRLREAVEEALRLGCWDAAAVEHLLDSGGLKRVRPESLDVGVLLEFERPLPQVREYDDLLTRAAR
ncbi:MAG TPA: IS21 family transposase, partial [Chloroflexota bacterium]|nr:IS21 family transposase [Chloroflexota bacterium]